MKFKIHKTLTLFLITILLCNNIFARDKTDVITLKNGDHITGEIKKLTYGKLELGTDSMGTLHIEWDDIAMIKSDYEFQFEESDGTRKLGKISKTDELAVHVVLTEGGEQLFKQEDLIRISQNENSFMDRVSGSLSFGYSYTKASEIAQYNLGFGVAHKTPIRSFSIDGSTIQTRDDSTTASTTTQRYDLGIDMTKYRDNRWFNQYFLNFESNDELNLDLRSSLGASFGRYMIQNNSSELALLAGIIATNEKLMGNLETQENIEGLIGIEYSKYHINSPVIDLSVKLSIYPSITESGRTRAQLDTTLRQELIPDLFLDLTFYDSYDSMPTLGAEATNDYGIATSLGWSF